MECRPYLSALEPPKLRGFGVIGPVFSRPWYHSGLRRFAPFSKPWYYILLVIYRGWGLSLSSSGVVSHKLYSTSVILQIHVQARSHV